MLGFATATPAIGVPTHPNLLTRLREDLHDPHSPALVFQGRLMPAQSHHPER